MTEDTASKNWNVKATGPFLARILNINADMDAIMDAAKEKCAPLADDIKAIKKEASDEGIPRREFNKMVATMKRLQQELKSYDKMNQEEKEVYDIMREACGLPPMEEISEQLELKV